MNHHVPPHTLIRSKRKTISLSVSKDALLIVRAPLKVSVSYIEELLISRSDWIIAKQDDARRRLLNIKKIHWNDGEYFLYLGELYLLQVRVCKKIEINHEEKIIYYPYKNKETIQEKLTLWYKEEARRVLETLVGHYKVITNYHPAKIGITSATTRWGSCSGSSVNFSWRLLLAPKNVIDYVVVHELVHIEHKNHGPVFWKTVDHYIADRKEATAWLKTNQPELDSYL